MSLPARVTTGVPSAGQYATSPKSEPNLSLVPGDHSPPALPDRVEYARAWPNRHQRLDRLNERWYAIVAHPRSLGPDRLSVVRSAVRETLDVTGRFVSLPEDDGEGESYVLEALTSDRKVEEALNVVGSLNEYEARSFGNRLAGALHDIESAIHGTRVPLDADAVLSASTDEWPAWLPTEPPEANVTW